MWKLRPETWKGAGILPGSGGKAVGMVGGQGPEFPARETGASVSSVWSWKHSGGSKGQPPNLLWRGGRSSNNTGPRSNLNSLVCLPFGGHPRPHRASHPDTSQARQEGGGVTVGVTEVPEMGLLIHTQLPIAHQCHKRPRPSHHQGSLKSQAPK